MTMFNGEEMRGKLEEHLRRLQVEVQVRTETLSPKETVIELSNVQEQQK